MVEALLEARLVDVVLVLADADRLGVDLHQFGQRVHQAAADANGAAHRHVLVGKLFPRRFRCRIDGSTRLVDHENVDGPSEADAADEHFRLAACRAVTDGDGIDGKAVDEVLQCLDGAIGI